MYADVCINLCRVSRSFQRYTCTAKLKVSELFLLVLKFIYSEKATKFCEIFTLLLTVCTHTVVKSKVKISQNFVAFSEYMNFKSIILIKAAVSPKTKPFFDNWAYGLNLARPS